MVDDQRRQPFGRFIDGMGVGASGTVMLMTVIGGAGSFFGPILGAVLVTFLQTGVSVYTNAWLFYFGLLFLVVMYCTPDGLTSLVTLHRPVWRTRLLLRLLPSYGLALFSGLIMVAGIVVAVEVIYRLSDKTAGGMLMLLGARFNPAAVSTWMVSFCAMGVGGILLLLSSVRVQSAWKAVMEQRESAAGRLTHP